MTLEEVITVWPDAESFFGRLIIWMPGIPNDHAETIGVEPRKNQQ